MQAPAQELESSEELLACDSIPTPEQAGSAIKLQVSDRQLELSQTGEARGARYLVLADGNRWRVARASFEYAEPDPETGEMVAVIARYEPAAELRPLITDYRYDQIEPQLVKKVIQ